MTVQTAAILASIFPSHLDDSIQFAITEWRWLQDNSYFATLSA